MATANIEDVLRVPCRLCAAPTDFSAAFPHGGTALGLASRVDFKPRALYSPITAEEWGGMRIDAIYCGEQAELSCFLRGWDADALQKCFPNTSLGSYSGRYYIRCDPGVSGQNRPGYLMSSKAIVLVVSPVAANYAPGIVLHQAIPLWAEAAELAFRSTSELGLAVTFLCLPDSSGRLYREGWLRDISL
jgi:hypothetical protein